MADALDLVFRQLSPPDRKLLQMSVHINPILVANADGKYSLREQAAMAEAVRKLMSEDEYRPLIALAGQSPISDASLRVLLEEHSSDIDGYLKRLRKLLDRLPEEVASSYRQFTIYSILNVAEASRETLFGLVGKKISASEQALIQKMVDILGLELNQEQQRKLGVETK